MPKPTTADADEKPQALWEVLQDEFIALGETLPNSYTAIRDVALHPPADVDVRTSSKVAFSDDLDRQAAENEAILPELYKLIHARAAAGRKRTALCFSGGGIRSATFNLGLLQKLTQLGLLTRFDYLSTVSGGGYLGSWLTGWIHRHPQGVDGVVRELNVYGAHDEKSAVPRRRISPVKPEPAPVRHLRTYSRYLSPNLGVLSADTWTLVSIYTRNLLLNWLVLIPLLLAVLAIPRICAAYVTLSPSRMQNGTAGAIWGHIRWGALWVGFALAVAGYIYAGLHQPSALAERARRKGSRAVVKAPRCGDAGQLEFLKFCLLPILLSAVCLSSFWAWEDRSMHERVPFFFGFGVYLGVVGWSFFATYDGQISRLWELLVVIIAGIATGLALWGSAHILGPVAPRPHHGLQAGRYDVYYTCLAFPLTLASLSIGGIIYVGCVSRLPTTRDEDREWWARCGAWVLIAAVSWFVISALVLYGPAMLLKSVAAFRATVSVGAIAGAATLFLGCGKGTTADKEEPSAPTGVTALLARMGLAIATPLFVVFIVVVISYITTLLLSLCKPSLHIASAQDHYDLLARTSPTLIMLWALALLVFGLAMSRVIDLNKFSLHGMYRDRLVRAYLGASRAEYRRPDPFTGFDPMDNIQVYKLRPEILRYLDILPEGDFFKRLISAAARDESGPDLDPVSSQLLARLSDPMKQTLIAAQRDPLPNYARFELLDDLNRVILTTDFRDMPAWTTIDLDPLPPTRSLQNRHLLHVYYPDGIVALSQRRSTSAAPLHLVNIALNLVHNEDPAWQERKAESFTVSCLHSGSAQLGYRDSRTYGGDRGINLGTAITISGAAVSPNMGYHSSTPIALLLTLFNVRLGWWLGNPGEAGKNTRRLGHPRYAITPIVAEAMGLTDANHGYVYLSDGGHFENLGLYEMVRRRCHIIVLGDAGRDPDCTLEDLGNAVRKVRIDMGISITFNDGIKIYGRTPPKPKGRYCAIGDINYTDVDGPEAVNGKLLYIKPEFYGKEPADVFNFAKGCEAFPHESTADQFFTESQFESYRMLGYHTMQSVVGQAAEVGDLDGLLACARKYLKVAADAQPDPLGDGLF
ncbi:MAG TPA: hypothetical protein VG326_11095 [Tepidisphaeraceae bacterium]|jgi:hypothetical protein|nr:hypothetical protein [Tepidisphaeraceae bacterium]